MKLAQTAYDNAETGCCARLDPVQWDERELFWHEKPFLTDHIRSFFHVPLNFGSVMARDHASIEAAEAYPEQPFWLSDEVSSWGSDVFVAVDRNVPGARMVRLSGAFLTKVFEGPYRNARQWVREMDSFVRDRGRTMDKVYFFYATCPKCAKRFGKNQVVLVAQVH
jgi:hypothetical protein